MDAGKHFLTNFIDCYEMSPSLWDNSCPEYTSRHTKYIAYNKLLKIMKKYKKDANVMDVKRKINTLRSNFRREMNRIAKSEARGDSPLYTPNLWWFEKFSFLKNLKNFKETFLTANTSSSSNTAKQEEVYVEEYMLDEEQEGEEEEEEEEEVDPVYNMEVKLEETRFKRPHVEEPYIQPVAKKYQKRDDNFLINYNSLPATPISTPTPAPTPAPIQTQQTATSVGDTSVTGGGSSAASDTIDHLCKAWAGNLREMTKIQRIIAERAISEIIFQGQVGVLRFDSIPKMPANASFASSQMQMVTNSSSSAHVSGSGTADPNPNEYSIQQQSNHMVEFQESQRQSRENSPNSNLVTSQNHSQHQRLATASVAAQRPRYAEHFYD